MRTLITSAAVIFGLLGAGAAPALAGKGVKKNANGTHQVQGVVTHVHHNNAKNGNNAAGHIGEITIKTHQSKKKGQAAAAGKKAANQTHKITIGKNTKFTITGKQQQGAATFAAVRAGEHVTVTEKGNHAETVAIHTHTKTTKKIKKKK